MTAVTFPLIWLPKTYRDRGAIEHREPQPPFEVTAEIMFTLNRAPVTVTTKPKDATSPTADESRLKHFPFRHVSADGMCSARSGTDVPT
jgi:hypothetical protein